MDTTITPSANPVYIVDLQVPSPGDDVKSAMSPGAVRPAYQKLLDATTAIQNQILGVTGRILIESSNGTQINIAPWGGIAVSYSGNTYIIKNRPTGGFVFGINAASTLVPSGSLAANTVYYFYIKYDPVNGFAWESRDSGGADAPDISAMYAGTGTDRFFLGLYCTDHAANIVPYQQIGSEIYFKGRTLGGTGFRGNRVLYQGNATSRTNITTIGNFALWGRSSITLEGQLDTADSSMRYGHIGQAGSGSTPYGVTIQGNNGLIGYGQVEISGGSFDYFVNVNTALLTIWIAKIKLY